MQLGIFAALVAGAMWGITFVAPRAIAPFTELDLAFVRNIVFSLLSVGLMILPACRPNGLSVPDRAMSIALGFIGYVGIFLSVSFAVTYAGAAIPPLIVGLLPVVLAIVGNLRRKTLAWRRLALPLTLIGGGASVINIWLLRTLETGTQGTFILIGVLFSLSALGCWVLYGVLNARAMERSDSPGTFAWTSLHGIGALLGLIPIGLMMWATGDTALSGTSLYTSEGTRFLFWAMLSGIGGSWVAVLAWAAASKRLPLALASQLLVSEVVFALIYGFIYEWRIPNPGEWIGSILMIAGVVIAIHASTERRRAEAT